MEAAKLGLTSTFKTVSAEGDGVLVVFGLEGSGRLALKGFLLHKALLRLSTINRYNRRPASS